MTQSCPGLSSHPPGGKSPSPCAFPPKQHPPSQQHQIWLGSTAPFQHKSCPISSSQHMQYPGFISPPFLVSVISLPCSSPCPEPHSAALSKNTLIPPPSGSPGCASNHGPGTEH